MNERRFWGLVIAGQAIAGLAASLVVDDTWVGLLCDVMLVVGALLLSPSEPSPKQEGASDARD